MKRSRAPSVTAAAASSGGRSIRGAPTTRGNSENSLSGGCQQQQQQQEESQPSLEVDVGMEDLNDGGGSNSTSQTCGKLALRRRSSRSSPASTSSSGNSNCGSSTKKQKTVGGGGGGGNRGSPSNCGSPPQNTKRGDSRSDAPAPRSPRSPTAFAMASVEANGNTTSSSSPQGATGRGARGGGGGAKNRGGKGDAKAAAADIEERGNGGEKEAGGGGGGVVKPEAREGSGEGEAGGSAGMSSQSPPPKKKKKYVRNPETHKEYRARMEAELVQARKMLEDANGAMVVLARDYKRQQAIIEKYRNEDMSLQSFSQLTQSQPTKQQQQQQQQQQQLQQLQLVPQQSPVQPQQQQQQQQAGRLGGNVVDGGSPVKPAVETLPDPSTNEPPELDADMSLLLSQDTGLELSQASALSISHLAEPEEPLSQATHWLAVYQDSQEAWSLDDILEPPEEAGEEACNGEEEQEQEIQEIDSVEAVALAAEALSPSKHQQGGAAGAGGIVSPRMLSPSSAANNLASTADLSPMNPPPPLLSGAGAGAGALLSPGGELPLAADVLAAVAEGVAGGVVRVGVACLVTNPRKPGCVLIGKRKGSVGAGTWGLPGGHLEVGEEWPRCAAREVLEETGLEVETPTFSWVMNNPKMEGGRHYVTIFMLAAVTNPDLEPTLVEPDKCEAWSWETWESLGDRLVQKKKRRVRGGSCGGGAARGGRCGPGERLFHPLAALRSTTYDPFRGLL